MRGSDKLDLSFNSIADGWEVDPLCKKCGENVSECVCSESVELLPPEKHSLEYRVQMRRGKPVTVIGEFHIEKYEAQKLLKSLKKVLGCGGSFKSGWMQIQGKRIEEVKRILEAKGFTG